MNPINDPWNLEHLFSIPRIFPCDEAESGGIHSMYYEGLPYRGGNTRIFAYYAIPEKDLHDAQGQVPAMVLVHGGGGTAYAEWVKLWADRGYAAIAMDLEGHSPSELGEEGTKQRVRHSWSGPIREGIFEDCEEPIKEQWMTHAVSAVTLAHSIIRQMPSVDPDRVGITGISWGGIVAGIAEGIDPRYAFGINVYGCGYLYESRNQWGQRFEEMGTKNAEWVKQMYDPSAYFPNIKIPLLWVNMINDNHFPLTGFCKSYTASKNGMSQTNLCIHPTMGHSHEQGWKPQEIYIFADSIVMKGLSLPRIVAVREVNNQLYLSYESVDPLSKVELYYTENDENQLNIIWEKVHCDFASTSEKVIRISIPAVAVAYFVNLYDSHGNVISAPLVTRNEFNMRERSSLG